MGTVHEPPQMPFPACSECDAFQAADSLKLLTGCIDADRTPCSAGVSAYETFGALRRCGDMHEPECHDQHDQARGIRDRDATAAGIHAESYRLRALSGMAWWNDGDRCTNRKPSIQAFMLHRRDQYAVQDRPASLRSAATPSAASVPALYASQALSISYIRVPIRTGEGTICVRRMHCCAQSSPFAVVSARTDLSEMRPLGPGPCLILMHMHSCSHRAFAPARGCRLCCS